MSSRTHFFWQPAVDLVSWTSSFSLLSSADWGRCGLRGQPARVCRGRLGRDHHSQHWSSRARGGLRGREGGDGIRGARDPSGGGRSRLSGVSAAGGRLAAGAGAPGHGRSQPTAGSPGGPGKGAARGGEDAQGAHEEFAEGHAGSSQKGARRRSAAGAYERGS